MDTKISVALWSIGISVLNFIVGFMAGLMWQNFAGFAIIFCFSPCVVTFIVLFILGQRNKKLIRKKMYLDNPVTYKDEDGSYKLNPADLYDAVEKLGYIEHEWKGEEL